MACSSRRRPHRRFLSSVCSPHFPKHTFDIDLNGRRGDACTGEVLPDPPRRIAPGSLRKRISLRRAASSPFAHRRRSRVSGKYLAPDAGVEPKVEGMVVTSRSVPRDNLHAGRAGSEVTSTTRAVSVAAEARRPRRAPQGHHGAIPRSRTSGQEGDETPLTRLCCLGRLELPSLHVPFTGLISKQSYVAGYLATPRGTLGDGRPRPSE